MFDEYALYLEGIIMALACDNSTFIKPPLAAETLAPHLPCRAPYPEAKNYPLADKLLDDSESMRQLIAETAKLMPPAKPKVRRKMKPRGNGEYSDLSEKEIARAKVQAGKRG